MPDFENVVVRAPYEAAMSFRNTKRVVRVDERFQFPIRSVGTSDVRRAALVKYRGGALDGLRIDFVGFDGALYRPYIDQELKGLWTPERCRSEPPRMSFSRYWGRGCAHTTMLGSPFRPSFVDSKDGLLPQARKSAPEAREEARRRGSTLSQAGLIFVEGVLYQATRTPGWTTVPLPQYDIVDPCIPDFVRMPGVMLIDPRHAPDKIEDVVDSAWITMGPSQIEVADPGLLPNTVEQDALGCLAVHMCLRLAEEEFKKLDRHFSTQVLNTVNAIESAIESGGPLAPYYEAIERIASWPAPTDRSEADDYHIAIYMEPIIKVSRLFQKLRVGLPPPSDEPAQVDGDEADDIAGAFSP